MTTEEMTDETQDTRTAQDLADLFITFLETQDAPEGLFSDDVFVDFTMPQWRLQTLGRDAAVALRRSGHPGPARVPRSRLDTTPTGFVLELEERWEDSEADGGESWYCRELFRADVADGSITDLAIYCTGDWDRAQRQRHALTVTLIRP